MASVTYQNIYKKFGDLMIIKDLNIKVEILDDHQVAELFVNILICNTCHSSLQSE